MLKKTGKKKKGRVFVGMSGGVDSSVSAGLLKKQGYDVAGVFIKAWSPDWLPCSWREERRDAMRVCATLKIPFVTLDLSKEYKKEVVDYMITEYKVGRVPNSDVMCNKSIKFGAFFKWAMSPPAGGGADFVATGHYAKTVESQKSIKSKVKSWVLKEGIDKNKDQSYFLWTLGQKELSKTIFPVGGLEKKEVRKLAERFSLPVAEKKDSQGLCFLGKIDIKEFLKRFIKTKRGAVLNEAGEDIGEHDGAELYALGERHGFLITKKGADDAPYYIIAKDLKKNTITVSHNKLSEFSARKEILISGVNWISGQAPDSDKRYSARIRYRQKKQPCKIFIKGNSVKVIFDCAQEAVSSGQSLVLYDKDVCLGGGIIR